MKREREHRKWIIFCTNKERAAKESSFFISKCSHPLARLFCFSIFSILSHRSDPAKKPNGTNPFCCFSITFIEFTYIISTNSPRALRRRQKSASLHVLASPVFKRNLASNSSPPFTATASRVHKAVKKSKFNCDRMDLGIQHGWQLLKDFKQTSPTSSRSPFSIWFSFAFNELLFH